MPAMRPCAISSTCRTADGVGDSLQGTHHHALEALVRVAEDEMPGLYLVALLRWRWQLNGRVRACRWTRQLHMRSTLRASKFQLCVDVGTRAAGT